MVLAPTVGISVNKEVKSDDNHSDITKEEVHPVSEPKGVNSSVSDPVNEESEEDWEEVVPVAKKTNLPVIEKDDSDEEDWETAKPSVERESVSKKEEEEREVAPPSKSSDAAPKEVVGVLPKPVLSDKQKGEVGVVGDDSDDDWEVSKPSEVKKDSDDWKASKPEEKDSDDEWAVSVPAIKIKSTKGGVRPAGRKRRERNRAVKLDVKVVSDDDWEKPTPVKEDGIVSKQTEENVVSDDDWEVSKPTEVKKESSDDDWEVSKPTEKKGDDRENPSVKEVKKNEWSDDDWEVLKPTEKNGDDWDGPTPKEVKKSELSDDWEKPGEGMDLSDDDWGVSKPTPKQDVKNELSDDDWEAVTPMKEVKAVNDEWEVSKPTEKKEEDWDASKPAEVKRKDSDDDWDAVTSKKESKKDSDDDWDMPTPKKEVKKDSDDDWEVSKPTEKKDDDWETPTPKKEVKKGKEWNLAAPPTTKRKRRAAAKQGEKPPTEQADAWSFLPAVDPTNLPAPTADEGDIWDAFFTPTKQTTKEEQSVVPTEEKEKDEWDFFADPAPKENDASSIHDAAPQQSRDPEREERIQNALQTIPDISFLSKDILFSLCVCSTLHPPLPPFFK